jgi:hypothetical protein
LDFGAPESEEFRKLLEYEISAEDLSIELSAMGISLAYVHVRQEEMPLNPVRVFVF